MSKGRIGVVLSFVLLILSMGMAQSVSEGQAGPADKAAAPLPAPASLDPKYVIGSEDVLNINVWKEPELSGPVPVRPDGKVSLPLLNDVQAVGLTPMQLADSITQQLKKFMEEPRVTVVVQAVHSRRVYLAGQIGRPGAMPLLTDMTVMQALASAGCCPEFANTKKIYVLRNEGGKQVRYLFNYKDALKGKNTEQNIFLKPGDTIVVP